MPSPYPDSVDFDLVVIGAGSGGLATAKRAAQHGARVALVEHDRVGGTCVIRGCVPKKLMAYAALLGEHRKLAESFGWAPAGEELCWQRLCARRDEVIDRLEQAHRGHLQRAGVTLYEGRARLADPHTVEVAGRHLHAAHIVVATGSSPVLADIEGADCCLTSDGFFKLAQRPRSAVLVGGSYIAVELACILQALGCQTTLVVRSRLLRGFDDDIATQLHEALTQQGIVVRLPAQVTRIEPRAGSPLVHIRGQHGEQETVSADACILFAIGRKPNTRQLGLREVEVALDEQGAVIVDEHHRTSTAGIYALGDVINRVNLTPVAIKAGRILADRLFAGSQATMSYDNIATAVFSNPPIGVVGLTEAEARKQLGDGTKVFKTRFASMMYAFADEAQKKKTLMKLVVDGSTDQVLGCHMIGDDAPEIIQGFAVAVTAGLTKAQVDATVAVHPTQAEELVLLR